MEQSQFRFSEKTIKQRKRRIWIMIISMPFLMLFFTYLLGVRDGTMNLKLMLIITSVMEIFIIALLLISTRIMLHKLRQSYVTLAEDRIELHNGRYKDSFIFSQITGFHVKRDKNGNPLIIKLSAARKSLNITGFDHMDIILKQIFSQISAEIPRKDTTIRINWDNPITLVLSIILFSLVVGGVLLLGETISNILYALFYIILGLVFVLYGPISRSAGSRFKLYEIVCGVIVFILGVFSLIIELLILLVDSL